MGVVLPKGKREWLKAALHAFAAGFVTAIASEQGHFSLTKESLIRMVGAGLAGGVTGLYMYMINPLKGRAERAEEKAQETFDKSQANK